MLPAAVALILPHAAVGQAWQLDLTGTKVRYDSGAYATSAGIAPQVEWTGARSLRTLGGSVAAMDGASWSAQGRGDGWLFLPASRSSSLGAVLSAGAGASIHSSRYRTAVTRAEARWMMGGATSGAWLGLGGATGWTSSSSLGIEAAWGPTAGFWTRQRTQSGDWTGSAILRPFRFRQAWYPELGGSLVVTGGRADFSAFGGWRGAPSGTGVSSTAWGGASLVLRVARHVALTVSGGSYPADFLQALPRGQYLSAGIRLANRFARAEREPAVVYLARAQGPAGSREVRFTVPGTGTVAIAGDWTGWAPVPMQRGPGNTWTLGLTLPSGVYRFSLITDGGRWIVPAEVAAVDDGLGGKTGLLVIP